MVAAPALARAAGFVPDDVSAASRKHRSRSDGREVRNAGDGVPYGRSTESARDGQEARNAGDGVPYGEKPTQRSEQL